MRTNFETKIAKFNYTIPQHYPNMSWALEFVLVQDSFENLLKKTIMSKVDHLEDNDHIDDADYIEDDDHFEGNLELMTIRGARGCLAKKPHLSLQPIATLHCPHSIRIYVMFFLEADNSNTVFVNTFGW